MRPTRLLWDVLTGGLYWAAGTPRPHRSRLGALEGRAPWGRGRVWAVGVTLSFLRALNFFRHSTVSCLCIMEATVERCWRRERHAAEGFDTCHAHGLLSFPGSL